MDYLKKYTDFLNKHLQLDRPLKIVCDTSNGTAILPASVVFDHPLLSTIFISSEIDPDFSAHGPNPLINNATAKLSQTIKEEHADLGVIFDSDGDRAMFVDENGDVLSPIAAAYVLFSNSKGPYVCDELIYKSIERSGLIPIENLLPSRVGAYFMKEQLKKSGATIGGEYSGHYYFKDFFGCDSGMFAAITFLNIVSKKKVPVSKLYEDVKNYSIVAEKFDFDTNRWDAAQKELEKYAEKNKTPVAFRDGVTADTKDIWFNVRPSNTEPIIRITVGGTGINSSHPIISEMKELLTKI